MLWGSFIIVISECKFCKVRLPQTNNYFRPGNISYYGSIHIGNMDPLLYALMLARLSGILNTVF